MGTYIISVAFEPGTYRQIRISSSASLRELSDTITLAYDLDEAHRPVFEAAASKKTWPKKFAGSNTKTTLNMRQVALHDSPFAGKGQVIYSLDRPRLRFTCRRLSALDEETEAPMVIARSGGLMMPLRHLAQVLRRLDKHPGRLAEVEADLETSNLGAALRRTLKRYLRAAANLYGVVPLSLVREIFSRNHGEISPLALARIAFDTSWIDGNQFAVVDQQGELADPDHLDLARYLVYDDLLEAGAFEAVLKQQAGKPFYTPPPAELLAYADDAYAPPSTQLQALRDFLVGIGLPARDAEVWMGEITCAIRCGAQGTELLEDMFKRYKLRLRSMEEGDRMLRLYADLANNTRMHANCGHTPEELFRPRGGKTADKLIPFPSLAGAQPMEEDPGLTKPRRNGPCPCGSGNKYKQCCGRTEP